MATGDAAAEDEVGARVPPGMGVKCMQNLFNGVVSVKGLVKFAMSV